MAGDELGDLAVLALPPSAESVHHAGAIPHFAVLGGNLGFVGAGLDLIGASGGITRKRTTWLHGMPGSSNDPRHVPHGPVERGGPFPHHLASLSATVDAGRFEVNLQVPAEQFTAFVKRVGLPR